MAAKLGVLLHLSWALVVIVSDSSAATDSNGSVGNNEATVAEPPSLVRELGVTAVEHDAAKRSLQLYVNWSAPTERPLPKAYFVRVKSINESSEYCGTMDFDEDINSTVTWLLVPPEVSEVEHDPRVLHECAYNVRVESLPFGGRHAAELNYTVPELVGSLWSCRQSAALPLPRDLHVSVVDNTTVDVAWELDAVDVPTVQGFSLKLGTEIVSPLQDWFEFGPEVLVEAGNWSGGLEPLRMRQRLRGDLAGGVQFLVQARAVDRRGCRGPPAEARFHAAGSGSTSASQTLLVVVLPVVVLAAAAAAVAALVCSRADWCGGGRGRRQTAQPWLRGYCTVAAPQPNGRSALSDFASRVETEMQ